MQRYPLEFFPWTFLFYLFLFTSFINQCGIQQLISVSPFLKEPLTLRHDHQFGVSRVSHRDPLPVSKCRYVIHNLFLYLILFTQIK